MARGRVRLHSRDVGVGPHDCGNVWWEHASGVTSVRKTYLNEWPSEAGPEGAFSTPPRGSVSAKGPLGGRGTHRVRPRGSGNGRLRRLRRQRMSYAEDPRSSGPARGTTGTGDFGAGVYARRTRSLQASEERVEGEEAGAGGLKIRQDERFDGKNFPTLSKRLTSRLLLVFRVCLREGTSK